MGTLEQLNQIFGGKSLQSNSNKYKCVKCKVQKSSWAALQRHHVTYVPVLIKHLCERCHARITKLNAGTALSLGVKLTNETRLKIWKSFLEEVIDEAKYDRCLIWFNTEYRERRERKAE